MTRLIHRIVPATALAALAACSASFPTAPAATPNGLVVRYPIIGMRPVVGSFSITFEAYTVDTDGVYVRVTDRAAWSSSNPAVLSVQVLSGSAFPPTFTAIAAGTAEVRAIYSGQSGMLPIQVRAATFPALGISAAGVVTSLSLFVTLRAAQNGSSQDVTSAVTWSSSNPAIAEVQRGSIVEKIPGNVEITASYNGLSDSYWISVPPRTR